MKCPSHKIEMVETQLDQTLCIHCERHRLRSLLFRFYTAVHTSTPPADMCKLIGEVEAEVSPFRSHS